jgi:hypothetical protein
MKDILVLVSGFLIAMIATELSLKGTKVQTGFIKVILIHGICAAATIVYLATIRPLNVLPAVFFWSGAFFSWFGVRSHIESSILLRMLYLLRGNQMTATELLQSYESHYGKADRLEELFRGGLAERRNNEIVITPKGRLILRLVLLLK